MKKIISVFLFGLLVSVFPACTKKEANDTDKKIVAVSFDAINEIVTAVAGDKVTVVSIIPNNVSVHRYEPSPRDLHKLSDASLLFINGLEMEPWAEMFAKDKNTFGEKTVVLSDGLDLIKTTDTAGDDHREKDTAHHESGHHHGIYDPHVWLGLTESAAMAKNAAEALSRIDPVNASYYRANAKQFAEHTMSLRDEYRAKISQLPNRTVVVGHDAFAYLCRDVGLKAESLRGTFNEGEVSAKTLSDLITFCKTNAVKVIFSEEQASLELSATLARNANARIETIYTLEQAADGLSLLERQKANLEKIFASLQ